MESIMPSTRPTRTSTTSSSRVTRVGSSATMPTASSVHPNTARAPAIMSVGPTHTGSPAMRSTMTAIFPRAGCRGARPRRRQSGQTGWRFSRNAAMPSRAPALCESDAITSTAIA